MSNNVCLSPLQSFSAEINNTVGITYERYGANGGLKFEFTNGKVIDPLFFQNLEEVPFVTKLSEIAYKFTLPKQEYRFCGYMWSELREIGVDIVIFNAEVINTGN